MKAQFKYAFLTGLKYRCPVFIVIFTMNILFILLGSLGMLPLAAQILSVSLGGIAVAVMFAANIGADIAIAKRMFSAPGAYLDMLTPVPRWKILFASIITMAAMDLLTMILIIASQGWLSLKIAGGNIPEMVWNTIQSQSDQIINIIWFGLVVIVNYFLYVMIILFCVTIKKSFFFRMRSAGFFAFILAVGCVHVISLLQLILAPLGEVSRIGFLFMVTPVNLSALPFFALLALLEAAILFVITSRLLEKKINL